MIDERAARDVSIREASGSWVLWFALLAGPIAWITQLVATYMLEEWFACSPGSETPGEILGVGVRSVALVVSSTLALVTVAAGLAGVACRRAAPHGDDPTARRIQWMAIAGIMNSVLYLTLIVVSFAPPFMVAVCDTSP